MDSFITSFLLLIISLALFSIFRILKSRTLKTQIGVKDQKIYGHVEILDFAYYLVFKKYGNISGRKVSRFGSIYEKYLSKQSGYSKGPYLWKVFGVQIVLVVTDFDDIMEILRNDAFYDRGPESFMKYYSGFDKPAGILINNGEIPKELKRFLMAKFGQTGVIKKKGITSMLADQLPCLLDHIDLLRKQTKNKVQVKDLFSLAVLNVIFISISGKMFSEDERDFIELFEVVKSVLDLKMSTMFFIWVFGSIPGVKKLSGLNRLLKLREDVHRILGHQIEEKEKLGAYKDSPNDVIDCFLQEIDKHKDGGKLEHVYNKEQLLLTYQDLLITAMDTTSQFLESFFMLMCLYPEVQAKVHDEIDSVMGTTALPLYFDCKSKMPYTAATILEVHRWAIITPVIPRMTSRDVKFKGRHLKKGTLVCCALAALRLDDTYWEEPNLFCPERFLNENNEIIQERVDRMLIFGHGKRVCPGETISPAIAFTFALGILQKYSVRKGDDSEILGMTDKFAPVNGPDPFHISFLER